MDIYLCSYMYHRLLSALLHMMGKMLPCKQMKEEKHEMYFGELWITLFKVMGTSERNGPANTGTTCTTECLVS